MTPNISRMLDLNTSQKYTRKLKNNKWNVSKVTNMSKMFYEATNFNQSLNKWNVSKVTNMRGMFADAHKFNQPLDNWDSWVNTCAQ